MTNRNRDPEVVAQRIPEPGEWQRRYSPDARAAKVLLAIVSGIRSSDATMPLVTLGEANSRYWKQDAVQAIVRELVGRRGWVVQDAPAEYGYQYVALQFSPVQLVSIDHLRGTAE